MWPMKLLNKLCAQGVGVKGLPTGLPGSMGSLCGLSSCMINKFGPCPNTTITHFSQNFLVPTFTCTVSCAPVRIDTLKDKKVFPFFKDQTSI